MPKKNRLTGAQIRRLSPEKRLSSSLFSLSIAPQEPKEAQIACVVSKKVSQKAVVRNRVKRKMREVLRSLAPLPAHTAIVLTAKKQAVDTPYATLRDDVAALIHRARGEK
jgi:ribonuclease P protein component